MITLHLALIFLPDVLMLWLHSVRFEYGRWFNRIGFTNPDWAQHQFPKCFSEMYPYKVSHLGVVVVIALLCSLSPWAPLRHLPRVVIMAINVRSAGRNTKPILDYQSKWLERVIMYRWFERNRFVLLRLAIFCSMSGLLLAIIKFLLRSCSFMMPDVLERSPCSKPICSGLLTV